MADTTSTPQHCPGYANFKSLKSFICKCPKCGENKVKKYSRMNSTGRTPAAPVTSPSTFPSVNLKAKAKAFLRANG